MTQLLFESQNFRVVQRHYASASAGVEKTIQYLEQPDVVIAVPILDDGAIVLVEHLRPILNTTLIECPGGKVVPGEDPRGCITRELEEEIGFTPHNVEYVSYFFTSVGSSTEKIHVFIASNLTTHERKEDDVKRMRIKALPPAEVWDMLRANRIADGKTELALYKFFSRSGMLEPTAALA